MTNDVMAYIWMLGLVTSAVLTVIGILRWLKDTNNRKHRLNIVSGFAFCILVLLLLSVSWSPVSEVLNKWFGDSAKATESLILTSKVTIKVLIMVLIVAFAVMLTLTAAWFVIYGLWAMVYTICSFGGTDKESLRKDLQDKADKLVVMLNNSIFMIIISGGVLAVFGILPVVMGTKSGSLAKCWSSGVIEIAALCKDGNKMKFPGALSLYMLIYISVLGIGYAVANIIFEIIKELFNRRNRKSFLSEYSNSIVLLAVGISVLLMFSFWDIEKEPTWTDWLGNFAKSFGLVLFVIALGVLTLEIVRLIMDMKEKLIRREARYLFVMLVGQCTVIIVKALSLIYSAFSSALEGNEVILDHTEESMENVWKNILGQIDLDVNGEINGIGKNKDGAETSFAVFEKKVIRK